MDLRKKLRCVVNDVGSITANAGFHALFTTEATDLGRRISLLSHLADDIPDSQPFDLYSTGFFSLFFVLQDAKRLLLAVSSTFDPDQDGASYRVAYQFRYLTWKLENLLASIPYEQFGFSKEVQEQVELAITQLSRGTKRYGLVDSGKISCATSQPFVKDLELHIKNSEGSSSRSRSLDEAKITELPIAVCESNDVDIDIDTIRNLSKESSEKSKKSDFVAIPEDFLCPISLELMRDPVIVATGQTYERSCIQRWIDSGHITCPKTRLKLQNFTLIPNYVLRSLIFQWYAKNNVEQPTALLPGIIKTIQSLVQKISSRSIDDRLAGMAEIRSLSESTDNQILIAEAGAIPILVALLTSDDVTTQEHAITSILNLSIYEKNKELIMLEGAIPSIVQVLRDGTMEARENAAATLSSLSLTNENKVIIGELGALSGLVELIQTGRPSGKKIAATALYNLCQYLDSKGKAGLIPALMKMLSDSSETMVDEALTILTVLDRHQAAIPRSSTMPVLIDLLRKGSPRNRENSAAILLACVRWIHCFYLV